MTTSCDDALEEYDALVMAGKAPDPHAFASRYPDEPDLLERIEALELLRAELDAIAGHVTAAREPEVPREVGDYRLIESLGHGGMGHVYVAEEIASGRRCALKLMRRASPVAVERFRREAQLASGLSHPGIAAVLGTGVAAGQAYIATELVTGASLRDMLEPSKPRRKNKKRQARTRDAVRAFVAGGQSPSAPSSVRDCVEIGHQVAEALAHAHEQGVVHRDVKPSNIMVTLDGRARLIDFGIALATDRGERLTRTGVFLGSHEYAAPEQLRGDKRHIGPWTDCYALGATLYQLLTRRTPFEGVSLGPRIARAGDKPDTPPRKLNKQVDRALDSIVMKALHPIIRRRFKNCRQMADAFAHWLSRR